MDHIKAGIFVAEGEKVVRRLFDSNLPVVSVLLTQQWFEKLFNTQPTNLNDSSTVFIAEKKLLETIVGYNLHQGIMAVGRVPAHPSLEETLKSIRSPHLLVGFDGLVNAENVGVVVRNCVAFGADAVIVGETSSSPYLRRAVRNSMGTVFNVPIIHVTNLVNTLSDLYNNYGTRTIAAHPYGQSAIFNCSLTGNVCIVFGNEGEGISPAVLEVCNEHAAIPMMNETDSLNVASASAVFLFEARKQRTNPAKP